MTLSNVLQVNVRLSEGGAAGVARSLADGLRRRGVASSVAYGYSKGGGASPQEHEYDAVRITPAPVAAANRILFPFLGEETQMRGPRSWGQFREAVASADVVHFHAVHSHIAPVSQLVDVCLELGKPLVWTMHDHWMMTGRCAQPGVCRDYLGGCQACPDLSAYPSARIDRARSHWPARREMIERLQVSGKFALVSCAKWLADAAAEAGLPPATTVTNSVDIGFWRSVSDLVTEPDGEVVRALFVCRDLRDPVKVNWWLLNKIASLDRVQLTIVGDNPSDELPADANYVTSTSDRYALAQLMRSNDVLVFSSTVDYYPLTLVEALVAGMHIVAIESEAAREFSDHDEVSIESSTDRIIERLVGMRSARDLRVGRTLRIESNAQHYSPDRMLDQYMGIYEDLVRD